MTCQKKGAKRDLLYSETRKIVNETAKRFVTKRRDNILLEVLNTHENKLVLNIDVLIAFIIANS
jgi:hypothetical protein